MQITCPQCTSRYKLPDEKIKSSGTKVRCPRCQHAFYVFPNAQEPRSDTKPVDRPFRKEKVSPQPQAAIPSTINEDSVINQTIEMEREDSPQGFESARTVVSSVSELYAKAISSDASPFKQATDRKKAPKKSPEIIQWEDPPAESHETSAPKAEPVQEAIRPFGDRTLAEIEKITPKKKPRFKSAAVWLLFITALSGVVYYIGTQRNQVPVAVVENNIKSDVKIQRPSGWYKDQAEVYQNFLTQMATMPESEQIKPEKRAVIAEALILNGILSGTNDQVVTGLGYASSLLATHPQSVYGLMGLVNFAIFQEDIGTLENFVKRWPTNQENMVEFRLASILVKGRQGTASEALSESKKLMSEYPDLLRAKAISLLIAVDNLQTAEQTLGPGAVTDLAKDIMKRVEAMKAASVPLPEIFRDLEKRIQRKGFLNSENNRKSAPKQEPRAEEKKVEVAKIEPEVNPIIPEKKINPPIAIESAQPVEKLSPPKKSTVAPNRLPKPDPDLIALNKKSMTAKSKASGLFQQATQRLNENRIDEAVDLFQKAIREDPDLADAYKQLGIIFMGRQQKDRALRNLKIYLQLKPESDDKQLVEGWITSMQ